VHYSLLILNSFCDICLNSFKSDRQLDDALALLHRDEVVVQEVAVQTSLQGATENLSPAVEAIDFPSVDPVEDVEEAVETEGRHVMRRDVLDNSNLIEHPNLRDEGKRLEPKREAPGQFPRSPARVDNSGEDDGSRREGKKMREVITSLVVSLKNSKMVSD